MPRQMQPKEDNRRIFLFSDDTHESEQVRNLLNDEGILYEEPDNDDKNSFSNNGYKAPVIFAKEGEYNGYEQIEQFVALVAHRPR